MSQRGQTVARPQRIRGLDGLRAVAALIVLFYHVAPQFLPGGLIGVDVFFVLSGFLITTLLLKDRHEVGHIRLGRFWRRRFRRLFPAVVLATVVTVALAALLGGDVLVGIRRQTIGSLTASYNWLEVAHGSSYFAEASPQLLTNVWSLAVEQQFYLLWPLIVIVACIGRERPRAVAIIAAVTAAGSITAMALLTGGGAEITRAYYGTDSHAFGLMIGAGIAGLMPGVIGGIRPTQSLRVRLAVGTGAWVGLAGIFLIAWRISDHDALMYPWGLLGASVCAALIIIACLPEMAHSPATPLVALLDTRPMRWLGERSYGIYLWHWPLLVLMFYLFPNLDLWPNALAVFALSVLIAAVSYRFVETPIRYRGISAIRDWLASARSAPVWRSATAVVATCAVFALCISAFAREPARTTAEQAIFAGSQGTSQAGGEKEKSDSSPDGATASEPDSSAKPSPQPADPSVSASASESPADPDSTAKESTSPTANPSNKPSDKPSPSEGTSSQEPTTPPPAPVEISGERISILGDSVTLAAKNSLEESTPGALVDGEVSRSVRVAPGILQQWAADGKLRDYVVIALATNGTIREQDLTAIMDVIGDRKLVLVTGYGPARKYWIAQANEAIKAFAAAHRGQVVIADWEAAIAGHVDLLAGDQIHPGPKATKIYAQVVKEALESFR